MNFEDPEQRFPLKESKHSDFVLFVGRRLLEDVDSTNPNAQNESHLVKHNLCHFILIHTTVF